RLRPALALRPELPEREMDARLRRIEPARGLELPSGLVEVGLVPPPACALVSVPQVHAEVVAGLGEPWRLRDDLAQQQDRAVEIAHGRACRGQSEARLDHVRLEAERVLVLGDRRRGLAHPLERQAEMEAR